MADNSLIPAPLLSAELQKLTGNPGPGLRKLLELAASARLPLEKEGRFWVCRRENLPAVATALGLAPLAPPPAPRQRRRATEARAPEPIAA
jgi:hypothetical protein